MSQSQTRQLPNQTQVNAKLAQAQHQINLFAQTLADSQANQTVVAESHVCAAIHQMLAGLNAALQGVNLMMPDPLPPARVSRRNLRDRFQAVEAESAVIDAVNAARNGNEGWLRRLEQQDAASAFSPLLDLSGATPRFRRDPQETSSGVIEEPAGQYLEQSLARIRALVDRIGELSPDDVLHYREAQSQQARRLI